MITCLTDTIGLAGCGSSTPVSGLYVNSLPGISIKSIEILADAEQRTYLGVWDDVQVRADAWLESEALNLWNKKYKIHSVTENIDLGTVVDTATTTANAPEYRGLIFDLDHTLGESNYKRSVLQSHYFQLFRFYSPIVQAGTVIKLFDKDTNTQVDSFSKDVVIGWNTIQVNKFYSARRLFVGVDSTNISSVSLTIDENSTCCDSCGAHIEGAKMTIGADTSTITEGENSFGLSVIYGVRCRYNNAICTNQDKFYLARWYKLGSELMLERLTSERRNFLTIQREEAKQLKAMYDMDAMDALKNAVDGISLDESDCCLDCDFPVMVTTANNFY